LKNRSPVLLLHRHAAGDLVQFLELERPEEFVEVEIAVVALGSTGVGAQEVQLRTVAQNDRIARQLDTHHLPGKGLDVGLEDMRLIFEADRKIWLRPVVSASIRASRAK